jgi:hypothetical protein
MCVGFLVFVASCKLVQGLSISWLTACMLAADLCMLQHKPEARVPDQLRSVVQHPCMLNWGAVHPIQSERKNYSFVNVIAIQMHQH